MNYPLLIRLVLNPKIELKNLKDIPLSLSKTFFRLHILLIIVSLAIVLSGFLAKGETDIIIITRYFGYTFFKWLLSIYLSAWAINRLIPAFKGKKDFRNIYSLVVISVSFLVIALSFSLIIPSHKALISFFSVIGLYYFYQGLAIFAAVPRERIIGFLLISLLVFAAFTVFFEVFLGIVFIIPIQF